MPNHLDFGPSHNSTSTYLNVKDVVSGVEGQLHALKPEFFFYIRLKASFPSGSITSMRNAFLLRRCNSHTRAFNQIVSTLRSISADPIHAHRRTGVTPSRRIDRVSASICQHSISKSRWKTFTPSKAYNVNTQYVDLRPPIQLSAIVVSSFQAGSQGPTICSNYRVAHHINWK